MSAQRSMSMKEIDSSEYYERFIEGRSKEEIKYTYEKAWSAKNFEIQNYWRRAAYFWAFQVAAFAGYFAVLGSTFNEESPDILFFVICIGFVTAISWFLTNKGSKSWQQNWELHVDVLENYVTGPLYKTIGMEKTFSVSRINEMVSVFFCLIWLVLGIKYWIENDVLTISIHFRKIYIVILTLGVIAFVVIALFVCGRGRLQRTQSSIKFYSRY